MSDHTEGDENSAGDRWVAATLDLLESRGLGGDDASTALASFGRRLNEASIDGLLDCYGGDAVRVVQIMRWHLGSRTHR